MMSSAAILSFREFTLNDINFQKRSLTLYSIISVLPTVMGSSHRAVVFSLIAAAFHDDVVIDNASGHRNSISLGHHVFSAEVAGGLEIPRIS